MSAAAGHTSVSSGAMLSQLAGSGKVPTPASSSPVLSTSMTRTVTAGGPGASTPSSGWFGHSSSFSSKTGLSWLSFSVVLLYEPPVDTSTYKSGFVHLCIHTSFSTCEPRQTG